MLEPTSIRYSKHLKRRINIFEVIIFIYFTLFVLPFFLKIIYFIFIFKILCDNVKRETEKTETATSHRRSTALYIFHTMITLG